MSEQIGFLRGLLLRPVAWSIVDAGAEDLEGAAVIGGGGVPTVVELAERDEIARLQASRERVSAGAVLDPGAVAGLQHVHWFAD